MRIPAMSRIANIVAMLLTLVLTTVVVLGVVVVVMTVSYTHLTLPTIYSV